jgi:hypothetical protein
MRPPLYVFLSVQRFSDVSFSKPWTGKTYAIGAGVGREFGDVASPEAMV